MYGIITQAYYKLLYQYNYHAYAINYLLNGDIIVQYNI